MSIHGEIVRKVFEWVYNNGQRPDSILIPPEKLDILLDDMGAMIGVKLSRSNEIEYMGLEVIECINIKEIRIAKTK